MVRFFAGSDHAEPEIHGCDQSQVRPHPFNQIAFGISVFSVPSVEILFLVLLPTQCSPCPPVEFLFLEHK